MNSTVAKQIGSLIYFYIYLFLYICFSYLTIKMKFQPCYDGRFYKDMTNIPKPINTCTDSHTNIYRHINNFFYEAGFFARNKV